MQQLKIPNGVYEIAGNLERNPWNDNIGSFTLGEVNDHVSSIVEMRDDFFNGVFPGTGNLRDLETYLIWNKIYPNPSDPFNLANYHVNKQRCKHCSTVQDLQEKNMANLESYFYKQQLV